MSLLWFDGFEQYGGAGNEALTTEGAWLFWTALLSNLAPRTGLYCMSTNGGAGGYGRRSLGRDCTTVGVGTGFHMGAAPTSIDAAFGGVHRTCIIQVMDVNLVTQVWLTCGTTGRLQAFCDANTPRLLGETDLEIVAGSFNHIEMKTVLHGSAGVVVVHVNGKEWLNLTGLNTIAAGATNYGSQVGFGTPGGAGIWSACFLKWDDIFVWDEQTGGVHDILGQYGVYQLKPNADDATHHDWTLTSGTHGYALLNEVPPDDDVNYVFSGIVNDRSDFGVEPLPANIVDVAAVMPCARTRKTDTGDARMEIGVDSGGTDSYSADTPITTSWTYYQPKVMEKDPNTTAAWVPANVNAALLTIKRTL